MVANKTLSLLQELFPDLPVTALQEALQLHGGDVERAAEDILSCGNSNVLLHLSPGKGRQPLQADGQGPALHQQPAKSRTKEVIVVKESDAGCKQRAVQHQRKPVNANQRKTWGQLAHSSRPAIQHSTASVAANYANPAVMYKPMGQATQAVLPDCFPSLQQAAAKQSSQCDDAHSIAVSSQSPCSPAALNHTLHNPSINRLHTGSFCSLDASAEQNTTASTCSPWKTAAERELTELQTAQCARTQLQECTTNNTNQRDMPQLIKHTNKKQLSKAQDCTTNLCFAAVVKSHNSASNPVKEDNWQDVVVRELTSIHVWAGPDLIKAVLYAVNFDLTAVEQCLAEMQTGNEPVESVGMTDDLTDAQASMSGDGSHQAVYQQCRKEAWRVTYSMQKTMRRAAAAFAAGQHSEGHQLALSARQLRQQAAEAHTIAAQKIAKLMNEGRGLSMWELDLHGLHAQEAIEVLQERLQQLRLAITSKPGAISPSKVSMPAAGKCDRAASPAASSSSHIAIMPAAVAIGCAAPTATTSSRATAGASATSPCNGQLAHSSSMHDADVHQLVSFMAELQTGSVTAMKDEKAGQPCMPAATQQAECQNDDSFSLPAHILPHSGTILEQEHIQPANCTLAAVEKNVIVNDLGIQKCLSTKHNQDAHHSITSTQSNSNYRQAAPQIQGSSPETVRMLESRRLLRVIVGRGSHSRAGEASIPRVVESWLIGEGHRFTHGFGYIDVHVKGVAARRATRTTNALKLVSG